jgi:hypothetical protein
MAKRMVLNAASGGLEVAESCVVLTAKLKKVYDMLVLFSIYTG